MKKMIYAISTYNVVIEYPNYIHFIMSVISPLLKVSVNRPKVSGHKISRIYIDEAQHFNKTLDRKE